MVGQQPNQTGQAQPLSLKDPEDAIALCTGLLLVPTRLPYGYRVHILRRFRRQRLRGLSGRSEGDRYGVLPVSPASARTLERTCTALYVLVCRSRKAGFHWRRRVRLKKVDASMRSKGSTCT